MTSNVSVKITADVADLQAKYAIAKAETRALNADLNKLARDATKNGISDGLKRDLAQAAEASVAANVRLGALRRGITGVGHGAALSHQQVQVFGYSVRHLAGELGAGVSPAQILLTQVTHLSAAFTSLEEVQRLAAAAAPWAVMGLGATALLAAGAAAAYAVYEEIQLEHETTRLAAAFALTGRSAGNSADAIRGEIDALRQMAGASKDEAEALVSFDSAHADISDRLAFMANQLLPEFNRAMGDKGPEAVNKLKASLANLTERGFQQLNREMLNLDPAEAATIENMLKAGDATGAWETILGDLASRGGISIRSVGEEIQRTKVDLKEARKELDAMTASAALMGDTYGGSVWADADRRVVALTAHLRALKHMQDETSGPAYSADIAGAEQLNSKLNQRANLLQQIAKYGKDRSDAYKEGDVAAIEKFSGAIKELQGEVEKYDNGQLQSAFSDYVARQDAKVHIYRTGAAQRIAVAREEADTAKRIFGEESREYLGAQSKLNAERRAAGEAATRDETQAAQRRTEIARDGISADLQVGRYGIETRRALLDEDVAAGRASAAEKYDILKTLLGDEYAEELGALERTEKLYGDDTAAFARAQDQKRVLAAKHHADLARLDAEMALDSGRAAHEAARGWVSANQQILRSEGSLVREMLSGRQTLGQALLQEAGQLVEEEIASDIRYWTERELLEAEGIALTEAREKGGLLVHLFGEEQKTSATGAGTVTRTALQASESTSFLGPLGLQLAQWLGLETSKTAGTVAGVASRMGAQASEAITAAAASKAQAAAQIPAYTGIAAMEAASAVAGIPYIGPVLAVSAAAAMNTLGASELALASFDVGTNWVPKDMPAMVHAGERIVPEADNRLLIQTVRAGAQAQQAPAPAPEGGATHIHFHGDVIDGPSIHAFFNRHAHPIARALGHVYRDDPSLMPG